MRETNFRTAENLKQLKQLQAALKGRCFYCRRRISFRVHSLDPHAATVDHFFPLALGGRDSISNVVLACTACNRKKGEAPPNLQDILRWNELAKVWPHIHPLSLDRHVRIKKRCIVSNAFIPWERLLESMRTNVETHTCSKPCSKSNQMAKHRQRRLVQRRLVQTMQVTEVNPGLSEHEPSLPLSHDGASISETE
jgi:CRISPR/Cas system Type II protein with McrA/HNH and RuvC-like nuclease domain